VINRRHTRQRSRRFDVFAMALIDLPRNERAAQYPIIRKNFQAAMCECGIEGPMADAWLDSTISGIQGLVTEIEISGGAMGGQA